MKIEMQRRITCDHLSTELSCFIGIQHTQRIWKHKPLHRLLFQSVHHVKHIIFRVSHAVGPVLQIEVHRQSHGTCRGNTFFYILQMFVGRFAQLIGTMLQRPLAKQVHHFTSRFGDPFEGGRSIHKPQYLQPVDIAMRLCPLDNLLYRLVFAFRHTGRGDLHPVHLQLLQQQTYHAHFLLGSKRYTRSLFTIAQRGIHDLYFSIFSQNDSQLIWFLLTAFTLFAPCALFSHCVHVIKESALNNNKISRHMPVAVRMLQFYPCSTTESLYHPVLRGDRLSYRHLSRTIRSCPFRCLRWSVAPGLP